MLLIVVGAVLLWQSGSDRSLLHAEHSRLKLLTGELIPEDPTKIYIRAIETGDPLDFAWRVYLPPNYQLNIRHTSGSSASGSNSDAVNSIFRVRLREIDGRWFHYDGFHGSSGLSSLNPHVGDFLREHPDQLRVEQLGRQQTEELDPSSEFVLLRVTAPEAAVPGNKASSDGGPHIAEPIIEVIIGPPSKTL